MTVASMTFVALFTLRPAAGRRLFQPPRDAALVEVVGRHLHLHPVADGQAHPPLPHLAADGGQHHMFVLQLDTEHCARQHRGDAAFDFDMIFFGVSCHKRKTAESGLSEPRR